jgi:hypothetical protein
MDAQFERELVGLATMSPAQLRDKWQRLFREAPPPFSADLLKRGIAYRLQERVYGKLTPASRRHIERLQRQYEKNGEILTEPCATTKPGTVLIREWRQERHHVLIQNDGYLYRDRHYNSLTQIAIEITGVRWSGPRFFGLRGREGKATFRKGAEDA